MKTEEILKTEISKNGNIYPFIIGERQEWSKSSD